MEDEPITPSDDSKATDDDKKVEDQSQPEEKVEDEGADTNADDSQPDSEDDSAESDDDSAEETETEAEEADDNKTTEESDEDLKKWAAEKNLPLDDPLALAKMNRELEKKMHAQGQENGELRKQVGKQAEDSADKGEDSEVTDTRKLLHQLAVTDFYLNNPEARQYDGKMAELLAEKPHLANDFEDLLTLAKARTSDEELLEARKQGEQAALKKQNQTQRQGAPSRSATTQKPSEKKDPGLEAFDAEFDTFS